MKKLFIGNVEYQTEESHLEELFAERDVVAANITIPRDRETGKAKGFAFVEVKPKDFDAALSFDGELLNGRALRISEARTPPRR